MSIDNEQKIIELAQLGDSDAIRKLVEEYAPIIFRFSFHVCRNKERAENTTQETVLSILSKLDQFDRRSKFSTWIYRIVANHCLMEARRDKARRIVSIDDDEVFFTGVRYEDGDPHVNLEKNELREYLDHAIQNLDPDYRVVFILRDIEQLSTKEVGRILGLSEAAVKSRLHRARKFLRDELSLVFKEKSNGE